MTMWAWFVALAGRAEKLKETGRTELACAACDQQSCLRLGEDLCPLLMILLGRNLVRLILAEQLTKAGLFIVGDGQSRSLKCSKNRSRSHRLLWFLFFDCHGSLLLGGVGRWICLLNRSFLHRRSFIWLIS